MKLVIFILFIIGCLIVGFLIRKGIDKLLERLENRNLDKE